MCTLEKRGRLYLLTITGSGEHRLNPTLLDSILSALAKVRADYTKGGSALITTAEGKFFSNGFDLAWAKASPSSHSEIMSSKFVQVVADLISLPMPTITAVTGHAAAAGFALALSHDYILMRSDRGFLYMSELDIGLPMPNYFMTLVRSKIKDPRALRKVALRSTKFTATEALETGIIDGVCGSAEETVEAAVRMGEELAGRRWDGQVYASIRMGTLPELARVVGLVTETTDEENMKVIRSML